MKKVVHLTILVGAVTAIVLLASNIAHAGTFVKTDDCVLTQEGGECVCTIEARSDASITAIYINNADTAGRDHGFTIRDLSLNGDLVPGAGGRCNLRGIGSLYEGWFDIVRRIGEECGSSVSYSPIPMEKGDVYEITLVGYSARAGVDCSPDLIPRRRCRNDISVDVRVSSHGNFSLNCGDYDGGDDDDYDDYDDDDDDNDDNPYKKWK